MKSDGPFQPMTAISAFPTIPALSAGPTSLSSATVAFPNEVLPTGWGKIPPDLAVEVVSPNDSADELEEKLDDYQQAGVPLVWVSTSGLALSWSTAGTARSAACVRATRSRARMSFPAFGARSGDPPTAPTARGRPTGSPWAERTRVADRRAGS